MSVKYMHATLNFFGVCAYDDVEFLLRTAFGGQ